MSKKLPHQIAGRNLLNWLFRPRRARVRAKGFRPRLECLEDRCVPAIFEVTTAAELQTAITNANATPARDRIDITAPGEYDVTAELNVTASLSIINQSGDKVTIKQTAANTRVFEFGPVGKYSLTGLSITGGTGQDGAGIFNNGSLTLDHVVVSGNTADNGTAAAPTQGGGIANVEGMLTIKNSVIIDNQVVGADASTAGEAGGDAQGGGIYTQGGKLTIGNTTISSNTINAGAGSPGGPGQAGGDGGTAFGAGIYAKGSAVSLTHVIIAGNQATGGLGAAGGDATGTGNGGDGGNGGTALGGGIYAEDGKLTLTSSVVAQNSIAGDDGSDGGNGAGGGDGGIGGAGGFADGAGIFSLTLLKINNSSIVGNSADGANGGNGGDGFNGGFGGFGGIAYGGGVFMQEDGSITNTVIANNTLHGGDGAKGGDADSTGVNGLGALGGLSKGAGLYVLSATVTVKTSSLVNNQAVGGLGGATGTGGMGDFPGANGTGEGGGATVDQGTLILKSTEVLGNVAQDLGGGIFIVIGGSSHFSQSKSTIIGNSPDDIATGI